MKENAEAPMKFDCVSDTIVLMSPFLSMCAGARGAAQPDQNSIAADSKMVRGAPMARKPRETEPQ
jgi:hypothetical protein